MRRAWSRRGRRRRLVVLPLDFARLAGRSPVLGGAKKQSSARNEQQKVPAPSRDRTGDLTITLSPGIATRNFAVGRSTTELLALVASCQEFELCRCGNTSSGPFLSVRASAPVLARSASLPTCAETAHNHLFNKNTSRSSRQRRNEGAQGREEWQRPKGKRVRSLLLVWLRCERLMLWQAMSSSILSLYLHRREAGSEAGRRGIWVGRTGREKVRGLPTLRGPSPSVQRQSHPEGERGDACAENGGVSGLEEGGWREAEGEREQHGREL